jgi:hypothetical protein
MPLGGLVPDSPLIYYAQRYSRYSRSLRGGGRRSGGGFNATYSWTLTNVIIYDAALDKELRSPSGILWKYMEKRGKLAVEAAKKQVGVKTGALRMSIHMKHLANSTGQYVWIGSNKNYAYIHHQGSRPHLITPSRAATLRFTSGGRVVYARSVLHPGTKPNRYLSSQMKYFFMRL